MIEKSVSLTLIRRGPEGPEIFWGRRRHDRKFLGGFNAFFAGSLEATDSHVSVDAPEVDDRTHRTAALRETFEEGGVLVDKDGLTLIPVAERRVETITNPAVSLAISRLHLFGWWTTPEWLTPTFSTAFYGLLLSDEEGRKLDDLADHLDPREFDQGTWLTATEALDAWHRGRAFATTPIRLIIESLVDTDATLKDLPIPETMGPSPNHPGTVMASQLCGGLYQLPLRTLTLPPATHTNTVIAGHRKFVIIDPGPAEPDELRPLIEHLDHRDCLGHRCIGVALTHHHRDHIGGLEMLSKYLDVPLLAHIKTLEHIDSFSFDTRPIGDGDLIDIDHPDKLHAIHTPGHASGHLAFYQPDSELLIAGDLVAGKGTIIIDPPDGNMGDYLRSLRRIRNLSPRALLPAHGFLFTRPVELLDKYLSHRHKREQEILHALQTHGPATAETLVPHVYTDAPRMIWPLAQRSLMAHLNHLVEQDLVTNKEDGLFAMV